MTKKENNKSKDKVKIEENILEINYEDEMRQSYIDYAMSVIVQRALPDVRDGLKPVHRRILFAMNGIDNFPKSPHKKSARIIGETLGKYHPHGDASVYNAMVRMSQDFSLNHPLVDGHGNFGSIDGDAAASMRYTEARLTPLAMESLKNLEKNVVSLNPNFDNTLEEPSVLPVRFPNLLINGSSGIAVGMATNIPSHNFEETTMAVIDYLNNPDSDPMDRIKGPDFPTGGVVINKDELRDFYEKGSGRIRVRAKMEVEDIGYGRKNIVITEIPYTYAGSKTQLLNNIINQVNNKKLEELTDVRDESSMAGIRIILEVKKGVDIERLKRKLYARTKLEDTFGMKLLAIENNEPKTFSLKEMIASYGEFLKEINRKELEFDLNKAKNRQEIVEGLIKAVDIIDLIIEIIRNSKNISVVKDCLMTGKTKDINFRSRESEKLASKLSFTEAQANAILSMQLQRLVGLEMEKVLKEEKELQAKIKKITKILKSDKLFNNLIKDDLLRILKINKRDRRTEIIQDDGKAFVPKPKPEEDYFILIDKLGYIKAVDEQSIVRSEEETINEYSTVMKAKNTDTLLVFSENGDLQQIKVEDIPHGRIRDKGVPIEQLVNDKNYILMTPRETKNKDLVMISKKGLIKRVERDEFDFNRRESYSTKLNEGDSLFAIHEIQEDDMEVEVITQNKYKLRFMLEEVPIQKRNARGVISIKMEDDDELESFIVEETTRKHKKKRGTKGKK